MTHSSSPWHPVRDRRGFALLSVLWICVGIAALSWLITSSGRDAVGPARNRMAEIRAGWTANACLSEVESSLAEDLQRRRQTPVGDSATWNLGDLIHKISAMPGFPCELRAQPTGVRFDVNALDERSVSRVLVAAGFSQASADSGAAALEDWRDGDDVPRAGGAERAWYLTKERPLPSNRPFASPSELHLVRGFEGAPGLDSLLGTDPGPISLDAAPIPVLALLPGFSRVTAAVVDSMRRADGFIRSFQSISAALPLALRGTFDSAEATLGGTVVFRPADWVLTIRASNGTPRLTRVLEVHVTNGAMGLLIGQRRTWVQ